MKKLAILLMLSGFLAPNLAEAVLIKEVNRVSGQSGWSPFIGYFNGETDPIKSIPEDLQKEAFAYSDSCITYTSIPKNLIGSEYVRTFCSDGVRWERDVTYNFKLTEDSLVWAAVSSEYEAEFLTLGQVVLKNSGTYFRIRDSPKYAIYSDYLKSGEYKFGSYPKDGFYTFGATIPEPNALLLSCIGIVIIGWVRGKFLVSFGQEEKNSK